MAELADAPDLGSGSREAMGVRLPPFALLRFSLIAGLPDLARSNRGELRSASQGAKVRRMSSVEIRSPKARSGAGRRALVSDELGGLHGSPPIKQ